MKFGYKVRCHWLKEGVLPEYNHGAELKLSRYLPIFTTSRVSPTLLSSFNPLTALKKELSTVKVHYSLIMIMIMIMIIICISWNPAAKWPTNKA